MSNANNITLYLPTNGGVDRPLSYTEVDTNFKELKFVITEYNEFINDVYNPTINQQADTNTSLQNQIDSNDSELANHESRLTSQQGQIDSNDTELSDHETRLTSQQGQIDSNDTELADHETRLTDVRTDFDNHAAAADPHDQYVLKIKDNLIATSNPTVDDDETLGYETLSKWINTTTGEFWLCIDATDGAANWQTATLTLDELGSAAVANVGTSDSEIALNSDNNEKFVTDSQAIAYAIAL